MSARMEPLGQGLDGQVMTVLRQARQYPKSREESPTVKALAHSRGVTSLSVIGRGAACLVVWVEERMSVHTVRTVYMWARTTVVLMCYGLWACVCRGTPLLLSTIIEIVGRRPPRRASESE